VTSHPFFGCHPCICPCTSNPKQQCWTSSGCRTHKQKSKATCKSTMHFCRPCYVCIHDTRWTTKSHTVKCL